LHERAGRFEELDRRLKAERGDVSPCVIEPEPRVELRDGYCVAADGYPTADR
jgi:hypothetical protein